jgi:osmotically-inducible protein OsmY
VINEIEIGRISLATRSKDSWVAAQIRSKILLEKGVQSVNYSVEVINGVAYILGIAQDDQELESAEQVAGKVGGVKRVVSHVILKTDLRRNAAA